MFIKKLKRRRAYRAMFLTEAGNLSAEGRLILDDLYEFSRFFKSVPPEPQRLAAVEGSRAVVRRILKWLKMTEAEMKRQAEEGVYDDE